MQESRLRAYCFGPYRVDAVNRIVERDGERLPLTPKVVDTLLVLVERAGEVVTKEALMAAVWPDVTVVESGLSRNISVLRKAIQDDGEVARWIETLPRRGYRFLGPLSLEYEDPQAIRFAAPAIAMAAPVGTAAPAATAVPGATAHAEIPGPLPVLPAPAVVSQRPGWPYTAAFALLAIGLLAAAALWQWRPAPVQARNPEANVQIGQHLLHKLTPAETQRAMEYFRAAVRRNPGAAEAHAGLAISALQLSALGVLSAAEVLPDARASANTALQLQPGHPRVQTALGMVETLEFRNLSAARAAFERALALEPDSVQTRSAYARLHLMQGNFSAARKLLEEAGRLDPVSPAIGAQVCQLLYFQGDTAAAIAECRRVLHREPGFSLAHYYLGLSLAEEGDFEKAVESLRRTHLSEGVLEADYAWIAARQGNLRPAEAALARRRQLVREGKLCPSAKLLLAATLGHQEEAIDALATVVDARGTELLTLAVDPRLEPLRRHPRYMALILQAGIALPPGAAN